ncbi:hypothetical protein DFQ07_2580 [Tenacibaculum caenipelagi]|uniref:Uncharacterized protein n=1 Tax=Tenacibaculum caenipelagi TaxID=1325435 RepID=A0A4R6TBI6_9FLAO|nr:hypothetical protein DFQ07_2580 [Tenacibaculum caenipelagi]
MKDNFDEDYNKMKDILKEGKFKLNNPNFEETLMSRIVLEKNYKVGIRNLIKRALVCLIIGFILSISLVLLFLFNKMEFNNFYNLSSVICLFVLGIVGILLTDNFLKLLHNYNIS